MIRGDGWDEYSLWEHSAPLRELYARRARGEEEEMTAHAQAAELLAPLVAPGDTVLDAGCGSGAFFHSLRTRELPVEYHGIDASETFVEIGRRELSAFGLPPDRLQAVRIEDLAGEVDHVVCLNVLSNLDNVHRPFDRLLHVARKSVILRESFAERSEYRYVRDEYLDDGVDLWVHVNAYGRDEVRELAESRGFDVRYVEDRRSGGRPELVIGYPHHWTFLVAERR